MGQEILNQASKELNRMYEPVFVSEPTGYEERAVTIVKNILLDYEADVSRVSVYFTEKINDGTLMDILNGAPLGRYTHIHDGTGTQASYQIIWLSLSGIEKYGWSLYRHVIAHEAAHAVAAQLYGIEGAAEDAEEFIEICHEVGGAYSPSDFDDICDGKRPDLEEKLERYL